MKYNVSTEINDLLTAQKPMLWGVGLFKKTNIMPENAVVCDDSMVKDAVDNLDILANRPDTPPRNASIVYNGSEYIIVDGVHGDKIVTEKLYAAVTEAASKLDGNIDLLESECYEMPEYTAGSQKVIDACNQANAYIKPKITINMGPGAEHFIIDKELINTWLFVTDNYDVFFDRNKVKAWVAEFAKTFNTYGQTREFLTAFGSRTTVKGGDFGWLIDQETEVQSLVNVIKAGKDTVRYPVYSVMGVGHGNDDIGSSYVEVDLTNQHVYLWINGKRILDAPCVTGLPPHRITPPGTFRLKKKMSPAILVGENYRTPVSYWMPFNGGIGLHDATWQSSFGGSRYLTHGSHGCVNLSLNTAKQIYGYVYPGMPVVCYYTNERGVGKMTVLPDFTTTTTTTTTESTTETTTIATTQTTTKTQPTTQNTTKTQPVTKAQPATQVATKAQPATQATTKAQPATQAQPVTQTTTKEPEPIQTTAAPPAEPATEPTTKKLPEEQAPITEPVVDDVIHEPLVSE